MLSTSLRRSGTCSGTPGGFESIGWLSVKGHASDLPPVQVVENCVRCLHLNAASPAPSVLHGEDEDLAPQVTHLLNLLAPLIPGANPTDDHPAHLLGAAAYADVRSAAPGRINDYVWIEVGQCAFSVSIVEGVVHPPHDLDVLLRHRPRSIPPGRGDLVTGSNPVGRAPPRVLPRVGGRPSTARNRGATSGVGA